MKKVMYAVGSRIGINSGHIFRIFTFHSSVSDVVEKSKIIETFVKSEKIQYFLLKDTAVQYTNNDKIPFSQNPMQIAPVYTVDIIIPKNSSEFIVNKLINATIFNVHPELELNYEIDQKDFESNQHICAKENFEGNFEKLQRKELAERESLSFLFGNKHGFIPEGQQEKYQLPKEIVKIICEYVREEVIFPILTLNK